MKSYLIKRAGVSAKKASDIKKKIFDVKNGLLSASSDIEFETMLEELKQEKDGKIFETAYMKSFIKRVFNHILYPHISSGGLLTLDFTTNDAEVTIQGRYPNENSTSLLMFSFG